MAARRRRPPLARPPAGAVVGFGGLARIELTVERTAEGAPGLAGAPHEPFNQEGPGGSEPLRCNCDAAAPVPSPWRAAAGGSMVSVAPAPDGWFPGGIAGEMLELLVTAATLGVAEVQAASVTLRTAGAPGFATVTATSDAVRTLDELQYSLRGGPCVAATETGAEVTASLPAGAWPGFSAAATAGGVQSVWSLPLPVDRTVRGALNLYSMTGEPWKMPLAQMARLLAAQASLALGGAEALGSSETRNANLREALQTRTVIGQAQGVLMARQNVGGDDAFDILRRASQRANRKLRDVAAEIVAPFERRE